MTQALVHQKYKLAVVSGGKPVLPRVSNRSSSSKTVTCLTHDKANYIVPFNNQIKIYSIETRQCVKTIKFANNETLSKIFHSNEVMVSHISLGDLSDPEDEKYDKITVITNIGDIVVLNYKGKLIEEPKTWKFNELEADEEVLKVFRNKDQVNVLTSKNKFSPSCSYELYQYSEKKLTSIKSYSNVVISCWSLNEQFLCVLSKDQEKKKTLYVDSIFGDNFHRSFPLPLSGNASGSSNTHFVNVMALDNSCMNLAIGFASGVINVINLEDLSSRILKWHIDSVLSLCFTSDGSYLLSGGWEKVLNFWQLSTNMQQFLPRLNGVIVDVDVVEDKYYSLSLQLAENQTNCDYQLLLLNSSDLTSRLCINGPLCVFRTMVKDVIQPMSAVNSKLSTSSNNLHKLRKKQQRKLLKRKRQDFTCNMEINPLSKHLYFPHISAVQVYDFYKNEQVSYQYLASGINNSMGKVRLELNLRDPMISEVKFTKDGKWMITSEIEYPPEDLLSSNDLVYVLKFWTMNSNSEWTLKTKVINPHGVHAPITEILMAPRVINNSYGCLTADNNGGLKYWSFNNVTKSWSLTRVSLPNVNHFSNSVALAWSLDGSLIFHAFDEKVSVLDFNTFSKLDNDSPSILNEITLDSAVQSLILVNDRNLIIATQTTLNSVNLLSYKVENSFDLYPFVNGVYKNGDLSRLISYDESSGRVALVVNQLPQGEKGKPALQYSSSVVVFDSDLTTKLGIFQHDEYISCIRWNYDTDFIFVDIQCRLGVVSTTTSTEMLDELNREGALDALQSNEFEAQLKKLSGGQRERDHAMGEIGEEDAVFEFINGDNSDKLINMNSFTSMFENIDNVQMDTLFDRVMRVIT